MDTFEIDDEDITKEILLQKNPKFRNFWFYYKYPPKWGMYLWASEADAKKAGEEHMKKYVKESMFFITIPILDK